MTYLTEKEPGDAIARERKRLQRLQQDARREGDSQYVKELQEELDKLDAPKPKPLHADALNRADAVQRVISKFCHVDCKVDEEANEGMVIVTPSAQLLFVDLIVAFQEGKLNPQSGKGSKQVVKHGSQTVFSVALLGSHLMAYIFVDPDGSVKSIALK